MVEGPLAFMPLELADPARCPGLFEFISIGSFLVNPYLTAGAVFGVLQTVVIVSATIAFLWLVRRTTGSLLIATAAAFAVALSPLYPATLAPPSTAGAFGACVAVALMAQRLYRQPGRIPTKLALQAGGMLLLAALIVPPCAIPRPAFSLDRLLEAVRAAGWALGPLVIALAALGALSFARRMNTRDLLLIAGVAIAVALIGGIAAEIARIPIVLVAWWLAVVGLQETIAAVPAGRSARVAAALVLLLLPALQLARRSAEERDDHVRPLGHEQLSLQRMRGMLNMIPDGGSVTQEDMTVDLLLRAATAGQNAKQVAVIARGADVVDRARADGSVYSFPRAQLELGHQGFVFDPVTAASRRRDRTWEEIRGLAEVAGRQPCRAMQSEWSDVSNVTAGGRVAVVAETDASFGPVILLLGGPTLPDVQPEGWTPRMMRGFQRQGFDTRRPAGAEQLAAEARALGVPADHPILAAPLVLRLSLHRIPRAPLTLPVNLSGPISVAIARLDRSASSERLSLCDASAARVTAFEIGQSTAQPR